MVWIKSIRVDNDPTPSKTSHRVRRTFHQVFLGENGSNMVKLGHLIFPEVLSYSIGFSWALRWWWFGFLAAVVCGFSSWVH